MIDTTHSVVINTGIDEVWSYVQDISKWAILFPGCKDCEIIDDYHSNWVIKVGAGGLIKTVNVLVTIDQWNGPESVLFSYKLESEPVIGNGSYTAVSRGNNVTEIEFHVVVEGSGQMAYMWEAMSKPLLPAMAKSFSARLKEEIENAAGITKEKRYSVLSIWGQWLERIWRMIFGGRLEK